MRNPDLSYASDGFWVRFYPETDAGRAAYAVMAAADPQGLVSFTSQQVPDVLRQLRQAGYKVAKARPVAGSDAELLAGLTA